MKVAQHTPKFAAIATVLRRRIQEGVYPPGSRLPSSNALPAEFGVGKQTIVRALAELAREGLITTQQGLGTFVAQALPPTGEVTQSTRALKVAVIFRRSLRPAAVAMHGWLGQVVAGVAGGLGLERTQLQTTHPELGADEPGRAQLSQPGHPRRIELLGEPPSVDSGVPLADLFDAKPDVVLPVSVFDDAYLQALVDAAQVRGVPVVSIDYWTRKLGARVDCVVADNLPGYLAACEWFIEQGLRRVHFVGAYSVSHTPGHFRDGAPRKVRIEPDTYLRQSAWRQAMDEAGIETPPEWMHHTTQRADDWQALAEKLCALPTGERPEALLCHDAGMAEGLRACFEARGQTVAALGVCEPQAGARLTLSGEEMGRTAAALALARVEESLAQAPKSTDVSRGALRPCLKVAVPTRFHASV